ncbi:BatD family protein [Hydrogenimonas sp.]|uniref:BatD family protein n=1 Tax=Hydrogenimonas sp. TaxID=2231112 RepID=UPI002626407D|nr:BatD family protein [Hydrogenimonas sp.]
MSIPGRVILLLLALIPLAAEVKVSVDENPVIAGESVEMTIEAEGEDIRFPDIATIDEYNVTTEGMQRFERLEENRTVVKWIKLFAFTPKKSVTIPSYEVVVDGKVEKTNPLFVQVQPAGKRISDDFKIEMETSRTTAYVGQMVDVTIRFREKRDIPVMNVDFVPIRYENFWVKRVDKKRTYAEGDYLVHEIHYLFFPQIAGTLTIGPAEVKVAMTKKIRDAFGFIVRRPQWITLSSRSVDLHVEPLPEGVRLVGNFTIHSEASPRRVEKGNPVSLMVHVEAEGNIEDFELPSLQIDGVTIYGEEPKIEQHYSHGVYRGSWEKRYVLIAEKSFTIPSFGIRYFDPDRERIETAASEPISIEVTGAGAAVSHIRSKSENVLKWEGKMDMMWIYMNLALAFLLGMGVMYLLMRWGRRRREKRRLTLYSVGGDAVMLQRLMPYISESKEAAQMAENIYAAIFEGKAVKVERKAFEKLMKELKRD